MDIPFDRAARPPETVLVRELGNEAVLLNLDKEEYFGLDDVGTAMWQALTMAASIEGAYRALLDDFEVDGADLRRDLTELVTRLVDAGLIRIEDAEGQR